MHISTKFSLILPSILADLHHPSSKHLYANKDSSPQFSEPVCDVGKDCEISMSPMDPEIKQIRHWDKQEETAEYWEKLTMAELENAEKVTSNLNKKKAKYSIIFLGDGMGIPTITAGRIYSGQKLGMINAESYKTGIDKVADQGHTGLSKTYCIDRQTTDSAASATAYLTGVKGMYYTMGLNGAARKGDCEASGEETYVESVLKKAKRAGFATGLVTTTRVHHASPSGAFANSPNRMWYTDADMPEDQKKQGCKDLAYQVVTNSDMVDVHLGGGYRVGFQNVKMRDRNAKFRVKMSDFGSCQGSFEAIWDNLKSFGVFSGSKNVIFGHFRELILEPPVKFVCDQRN